MKKNKKLYLYEHVVLLHETNAMGGVVYFSNFVKWQGMAREYILREHLNFKELMARPIEMVTQTCAVRFIEHLYFGDVVQIKVLTANILPTSFVMTFQYHNKDTKKLVATGEQKITFVNTETGNPCRIPEEILELAKAAEMNPNNKPDRAIRT